MPAKGQRIPPSERFFRHVAICEESECWLWTGSTNYKGYGLFKWSPDKNAVSAPRASWVIANGEIPDGMHVLHRCDTPECVNPNHLFLGTNKDNMQDRGEKGRTQHGDRSGRAKVTSAQVVEIRKMYSEGTSQVRIAGLFNIHPTTVGSIVHNKTWR